MELFLQYGFGMKQMSKDLISAWGKGTVILSPRDIKPERIEQVGIGLKESNGKVLLDPQFYLPRSDYQCLTSYDYWPRDYDTQGFSNANRKRMLQSLVALNNEVGSYALIVPGERAADIDDLWLDSQISLLNAAMDSTDLPLIATICLSSEAVRSNEQINALMELLETQKIYGYYLVFEHPGNLYLVNDPQWLSNSLDLAAGLRRQGVEVIMGYSNQQQLIMACAGVTAISSGTWMNVRSFSPEKFRTTYAEKIIRRAVWYYCPQALSEYRLSYLDIGARLGLTENLKPVPNSVYAEPLFDSPQPSASGWSESLAFKHYLSTLHIQAEKATLSSFNETYQNQVDLLQTAESLIHTFRSNAIVGETRDFYEAIDANRAAMLVLAKTHGPLLERSWGKLVN